MLKPEQVPKEAVKAAHDKLWHDRDAGWDEAIAAALNAWPGMEVFSIMSDGEESIVLPITQENTNERE